MLSGLIDTSGSRKSGQRVNYKQFPGGFLKLASANAIADLKSTPVPLVIIEEPDDTSESVSDQGDAIRIVMERRKRQRRSKVILGGTPSVAGLSRVEEFIALSDRRVLPIRCHECNGSHVLDWENVRWDDREEGVSHEVYGLALPESAFYACPLCGAIWSDYRRKENILDTVRAAFESGDPWCGWEATSETSGGVVGFTELNELYVCMPGTSLADVVRDFLQAEHDAALGDDSGRIVFTNSKLGRPYEYKGDQAGEEDLRARAMDYPEGIVPRGGLLVTIGVDVQHDRLAVIVRAWGREEESWLVHWGELYAENTCVDRNDAVWEALDRLVFSPFEYENGNRLRAKAISIDSGDGNTNDAVYYWVRTRSARHSHVRIMAIKGASDRQDPEIFATPRLKSIDHHRPDKQTKADRHGVKVYIVGTNRAKDWLDGQMKLEARGIGRWHYYRKVRADYFEQITSEVKAPHKSIKYRLVWQLKSGRRNEALDGEVYALHAARAVRVHLMRPAQWAELERAVTQMSLFQEDPSPPDRDLSGTENTGEGKPSLAELARKLNG